MLLHIMSLQSFFSFSILSSFRKNLRRPCLILIRHSHAASGFIFMNFFGMNFLPGMHKREKRTERPMGTADRKGLSACVIDYCLSALPVVLRTFCLFVAGIYPINSYPRGETEISAPL